MSKNQDGVSLSSTEVEYKAMSVVAPEVMFCNMLLVKMVGKVKNPLIYEDNTGAIFFLQNQQVNPRTKHTRIRQHYILALQEGNLLSVKYTRSELNYGDTMTKNVLATTFDKFSNDMHNGTIDIRSSTDRNDIKIPSLPQCNFTSHKLPLQQGQQDQ